MLRKIILFTVLFSINKIIKAQDFNMHHVPKQYSIELGYRNVLSSNFTNKASNGYTILLDYAWQLSGLDGKKAPAYISVPLGYTMLMKDTDTDKAMSILSYGWTVRHNLKKNEGFSPFLGYALLLNQLKIEGIDGSIMGHQTKFEFGCNYFSQSKVIPFAKVEYSYTRFPTMGSKDSNTMQTAEIKIGARF